MVGVATTRLRSICRPPSSDVTAQGSDSRRIASPAGARHLGLNLTGPVAPQAAAPPI